MSLTKVMENWSEYDNKKKKYADANFFACTETWEVDYLIAKIASTYTTKSRDEIRRAIQSCCATIGAPHPRQKFVECVLRRLGLN